MKAKSQRYPTYFLQINVVVYHAVYIDPCTNIHRLSGGLCVQYVHYIITIVCYIVALKQWYLPAVGIYTYMLSEYGPLPPAETAATFTVYTLFAFAE